VTLGFHGNDKVVRQKRTRDHGSKFQTRPAIDGTSLVPLLFESASASAVGLRRHSVCSGSALLKSFLLFLSLSLSFSSCLSADFFSLAVFPFVSSRPQYFGKTHPYTYTHRRKDGVGRNETNGSRRWNSNCRGRASAQFGGEYRLRYDFSDDYDYNGSGRVHVLPHHHCGYYTTSDVHTHTQTHTHVGARSFSRQSRILLGRTSVRLLVHGHVTWPSRDINKTKAISMWYQQDNNIGRETQDTLRARTRARWSRDDRERAASRRNIRALQS